MKSWIAKGIKFLEFDFQSLCPCVSQKTPQPTLAIPCGLHGIVDLSSLIHEEPLGRCGCHERALDQWTTYWKSVMQLGFLCRDCTECSRLFLKVSESSEGAGLIKNYVALWEEDEHKIIWFKHNEYRKYHGDGRRKLRNLLLRNFFTFLIF